jgi:serine/threonine protein kinase
LVIGNCPTFPLVCHHEKDSRHGCRSVAVAHNSQQVATRSTKAMSSTMALFDIDEVIRGQRLGEGGFSYVDEVLSFLPKEERQDRRFSASQEEMRQRFAKDTTKGTPRYAIKTIQPAMMNDETDFKMAAGGLANEAELLSQFNHPNIIKLRGFPPDGVRAFVRTERYDGYFLILDRLEETLADRVESWKREIKRLKNPVFVLKSSKRRQELLLERLSVALDIASALEYLHSRRIVYRDLKTDNIGVHVSGVWQLFDFGLSRTLPRDGDDLAGSFQMSGKIGTKMYMAPEVYLRQPYNTKADVYSFALLLWEVLALQRPFARHTKKTYRTRVIKKGERPPMDTSWPVEIQELLKKCWSSEMNERPTMKQVRAILEKQVAILSKNNPVVLRVENKQEQLVPNSVVPSAA